MATLKQRMWRKNNAGTYDTIHLETESSLVLRPSGRTVEQDLTDFLPEVQATDDVPETLSAGKVKTTNKRPYVGVNGMVEGLVIQSDKPLCYEENGELPPYEDIEGTDADTLGGKPASDYVLDSELTEALAGKADATHTHEITQVNGLQDALDGKSSTSHTHTTAQVTGLDTALAGKANSSHTHSISDVTNLQTTLNGKAASSHNHSASNITSGTLPTSRGGTGITANPSMLINLGSTTAASVFATSPRPGVTGTLPVARGGTGVTSLEALKSSLGISSKPSNAKYVRQLSITGSCASNAGSANKTIGSITEDDVIIVINGMYSASYLGNDWCQCAICGPDGGSMNVGLLTQTSNQCYFYTMIYNDSGRTYNSVGVTYDSNNQSRLAAVLRHVGTYLQLTVYSGPGTSSSGHSASNFYALALVLTNG